MADWIPEMSFDDETLTPEEIRLGELFEQADQLAADRCALETFLVALAPEVRQTISDALACANAVRMLGNEPAPPMTGHARERLQAAMARRAGTLDEDARDETPSARTQEYFRGSRT